MLASAGQRQAAQPCQPRLRSCMCVHVATLSLPFWPSGASSSHSTPSSHRACSSATCELRSHRTSAAAQLPAPAHRGGAAPRSGRIMQLPMRELRRSDAAVLMEGMRRRHGARRSRSAAVPPVPLAAGHSGEHVGARLARSTRACSRAPAHHSPQRRGAVGAGARGNSMRCAKCDGELTWCLRRAAGHLLTSFLAPPSLLCLPFSLPSFPLPSSPLPPFPSPPVPVPIPIPSPSPFPLRQPFSDRRSLCARDAHRSTSTVQMKYSTRTLLILP